MAAAVHVVDRFIEFARQLEQGLGIRALRDHALERRRVSPRIGAVEPGWRLFCHVVEHHTVGA